MTEKACIDRSLIDRADDVVAVLKEKRLTIVTAESCTAGLVSAVLAQAKDAGEVLHGGFVTYSKADKSTALGVDAALLKREGSVNAEVVRRLACGALDRSPADVAVAVTGVLGPSSDEDGNSVGLVFFACCHRNHPPEIQRKNYGEQPPEVLRRRVVLDALALVERCAHAAHRAA
jgi:nicotinamide-nucleotide amidase